MMRNPENVLNSLSIHSGDNTYKFQRLYRNFYNKEMYLAAYQHIYANEGNMTKGADGRTIDGMSLARIDKLIALIKDESYQPVPARRTYIPKKNGKMRPLGIPSFDDKLVQEVMRMLLEAIYEGWFEPVSHGFRPNRSCHTALLQIQAKFTGTKWFVEGDIKGFFDNISHDVLIAVLRERIEDDRFLRLVRKFLNAGYIEDWQFHNTYSGTPQGGIISPILANIYLDKLDKYMKQYAVGFSRGKERARTYEYRKLEVERGKLVRALKSANEAEKESIIKAIRENEKTRNSVPYGVAMDSGYRRIQYVRYADDFMIGIIGSKQDCVTVKEDVRKFLADNLSLELSLEKTLITHAQETAHFLGYEIRVRQSNLPKRDCEGRLKRDYTGRVVLEVNNTVIRDRLLKYQAMKITAVDGKEIWKATGRYALKDSDDLEILDKYNSEIIGFYNYYSIANNSSLINSFYYMMQYSLYKTFCTKYRTHIHNLLQKYMVNGEFTVKYRGKDGKERVRYLYHDGFKRKKNARRSDCDIIPDTKIHLSRNSLIRRLEAGQCELCGAESAPIEIHHVHKLKDLQGKEYWEALMIARNRKTMAVCHDCHRKIHYGKID